MERFQDDNGHYRLQPSERTIIVGGPARGREAALLTTWGRLAGPLITSNVASMVRANCERICLRPTRFG